MKNGPYELIVAPDDYPGKRYRGKYAYEHRVNWWRKTGENPDGRLIHHKDEKKRNNKPRNLEAMTRSDHTSRHAKPPTFFSFKCVSCGADFKRRKGAHENAKFCSRSCKGRHDMTKLLERRRPM